MTKTELSNLKKATEKLTKWESSGKAFGHYQVIEGKATTSDCADRLYEFWCLMKLIEDLSVNYNITIISEKLAGKIFPQSPANKKGWSYFKIESKSDPKNKYQICYGTNIKLSYAPKTSIAPDISIQKHNSPDDPNEKHVELILDAKFKYQKSGKLNVDQIHAFIQRVNALRTKKGNKIPLHFTFLKDLKSNCLLTNGEGLVDQNDYCIVNNIKQVIQFDPISKFTIIG